MMTKYNVEFNVFHTQEKVSALDDEEAKDKVRDKVEELLPGCSIEFTRVYEA